MQLSSAIEQQQVTETEIGSVVQIFANADVEQASSSEPQQVEMLQV